MIKEEIHLQEIFDLTLTQEIFDLTLTPRLRSHKPLPSTSCDLCTCKVWSCYDQRPIRRITKKKNWPWPQGQGGEGHIKCYPVSSTSCDLCTSKVWCCYIPWLRKRCIYKIIHYLTLILGSRSYKMSPSTLDIMWHMHQQSLILLHPMVKENMHLQENTLFDIDLRFKVTRNVAQCPLHHVTYASTEFEVTTSKALGGEAFTRKFNIWPLPLTLGSRSQEKLPSTIYIMWPIQLQSLKLLPQNCRTKQNNEKIVFPFIFVVYVIKINNILF